MVAIRRQADDERDAGTDAGERAADLIAHQLAGPEDLQPDEIRRDFHLPKAAEALLVRKLGPRRAQP